MSKLLKIAHIYLSLSLIFIAQAMELMDLDIPEPEAKRQKIELAYNIKTSDEKIVPIPECIATLSPIIMKKIQEKSGADQPISLNVHGDILDAIVKILVSVHQHAQNNENINQLLKNPAQLTIDWSPVIKNECIRKQFFDTTRHLKLYPIGKAVLNILAGTYPIVQLKNTDAWPYVSIYLLGDTIKPHLLQALEYRALDNNTPDFPISFINSVAFSGDSTQAVSGAMDGTIKTWNTRNGECLLTLQNGYGMHAINSVAFSFCSQYVASASSDGTLKIWDAHNGNCRETRYSNRNMVNSVAFAPNNLSEYLASGEPDQIKIRRANDGDCLKILKDDSIVPYSLAFTPNGQFLASGSKTRTIKIWNTSTGELLNTLSHENNIRTPFCITVVACSPDNQRVASGLCDGSIKIWDINNGQCLKTLIHSTTIGIVAIAFHPDNQRLISVSENNEIKIWDTMSGECLRTLCSRTNGAYAVACSPDGKKFACGSSDGIIQIWHITPPQKIVRLLQKLTFGQQLLLLVFEKYLRTDTDTVPLISLNEDEKALFESLDKRIKSELQSMGIGF